MTTDKYFFSVDVETSGLTPKHKLLSVGAVAVSGDGWIVDTFYERIKAPLHPSWYQPEVGPLDTSTQIFWKTECSSFARNEAYFDQSLHRTPIAWAAEKFHDWVSSYGESEEQRIFVANPVSFDFMWIVDMFDRGDLDNPFHYRTLCLRSMAFGKNGGDWGARQRTHRPKHPHHPLSDAYAQAQDLIHLMGKASQLDPLDEPHYPNEPS